VVIAPARVGVVLHPPRGLLACHTLLDQSPRHQQSTRGQSKAAGRSEQTAPAEARFGGVGRQGTSIRRLSVDPIRIDRDRRGTVSWSCLVPVHGATPLCRRWPADTRCPRHAENSARAGRTRSAIAAQAISNVCAPEGSLSEAVASYGIGRECQSGALLPVIRRCVVS